MLRLTLPLFFTSLHYLFKVSIVSLSVCYVTALFYASTVSSSISYNTSLYSLFKVSIVSLSVCYVTVLLIGFTGSFLCIFYVTSLSLQGFHCFIICLLRHCSVLCFDCLFLCFLRHYTIFSRLPLFYYLFITSLLCSMLRQSLPLFLTSQHYLFKASIVLLSVYYVTALF